MIHVRSADRSDAALVHALYRATPAYFDIISIPVPSLAEVSTELATAERDPRRSTELVIDRLFDIRRDAEGGRELARNEPPRDPRSGGRVVGYLDYTLNYPERGDATVNLLLVHGGLQSRGYGRNIVTDLERRLRGRAVRLLASIYGRNPRAERFWKSLGYSFAIDAKPVLEWYAKALSATDAADPASRGPGAGSGDRTGKPEPR